MTSCSGEARSVQLNPSVTMPYTVGTVPLTASRPSTRTMVPMPTGESSAVQKWNSCGVFGRRSVATTRPKREDIPTPSRSVDCAQVFLTVPHPVHHLVPPGVGEGEGGRLGEDPARNLVRAGTDAIEVLRRRIRDLDAHESPHGIVAVRIAQPQVPARHRGAPRRR